MSTSGGYHEYISGVQYIIGGDIMMHVGGYHEYIGGCSVHRGGGVEVTISTSGDSMSISEDVQYNGGYHDACGGAGW